MGKQKIQQKIKQYFDEKKTIYELFFSFLETNSFDSKIFRKLTKEFEKQKLLQNPQEFEHFLYLIINVINNYHCDDEINANIKQILSFLGGNIVETFSNAEIFQIFKTNKLILLYLLEQEIIYIDDEILNYFLEEYDQKGIKYCHFFLPEIQEFIEKEKLNEIENEILQFDPDYKENYDKKRHLGENDSFICELIRSDRVIEFISYVNWNKIHLSGEIKPSIYETNSYLIDKNPTYIEYAAFFGSIQIIRYLYMNNVYVDEKLFEYAIHSKNADLIHFLEEITADSNDQIYEKIFFESIKCHHNDIADYIEQNLLNPGSNINEENKILTSLKYSNYLYIPNDFESDIEFFYLYKYRYFKIVNLFLKKKKKEIKKIIMNAIQNKFIFLNKISIFTSFK